MPTLDNIAKMLSEPKTGLVPQVTELEKLSMQVVGAVLTKKMGLKVRMDSVENALNNGLSLITKKLAAWEPLVNNIQLINNRLKAVEDYIPEDSLVTKVNELQEKIQTIENNSENIGAASSVTSNEDVQENKRKCAELSEKIEMASNYLEVPYKDVSAMKKQVLVNTAKRQIMLRIVKI